MLKEILEARNKERREKWDKMSYDQKQKIVDFQASINRITIQYAGANTKCKACSGPAYSAKKVAGNSITVVACAACKFVQCSPTMDG